MAIKVRRSSGNVFRDLGFPREEAENLKIRADLMISPSRRVSSLKLRRRLCSESPSRG